MAKLIQQLHAALGSNELVRVTRTQLGWHQREGYVAAVGLKWLLVASLDDRVRPDGVSAIRLRDVDTVHRVASSDRFTRRSLELHGNWPPRWAQAVDLDTTRGLISSMSKTYPLISLFTEGEDPDVCFIGAVERITKDGLRLREVTAQAAWDGTSKWTYGRLSRVDAGGGYETALAEVAGTPQSN